uniref:Uncharacterized protein n=1 Tax=Cupriavidus taiwanensis TaxID=164546 RepID=A0A375H9Z2_9BURK|nr:protein of unknown function [Cupriavidus taiwanensis]
MASNLLRHGANRIQNRLAHKNETAPSTAANITSRILKELILIDAMLAPRLGPRHPVG